MQVSSSSSSSSLVGCNFSFPLCVSGITRRLTLSSEMVDHERRRRAMKRRRSLSRVDGSSGPSGDPRVRRPGVLRGGALRGVDEIRGEAGVGGGCGGGCGSGGGSECKGCCCCLPCAARAA